MDSDNSLDSIYALPVASRRDEIIAAVDAHQVTIITAETGAGKSTQVPQFLAEHGYQKIIVTQPRILAARNLSARVRQEYSWRRGSDATKLVGYRTAHEEDSSPENVILYCTDGLQLVRELAGNGTNDRQVLVLDEIHEWNENMEVLIAWAKKRCQEEPRFKLVLMSATIEANSLAEYFGAPAPITIAGRSFPVEQRFAPNLVAEIEQQLQRRSANILVFLPGKAEIEQVAELVAESTKGIPVIPLHSQLELEAQQKAFASYPNGKLILSTNIAQTSITIDDIDVVIDSGLERQVEVRSGVEGLFISEVSQADCLQRAGRAGRTKPGLYILARYRRLPCSPLAERPEYGVPEIMRKHIDRLVLRLASIGIDIENLEFFHAPSKNTIKQAKRTLATLGAIENQVVTDIGHRMERFPVESSYARMLVEGERYSNSLQSHLAAIIAIQEVGGIVKGGPRYSGWRRYTQQIRSDLLAQYDVLLAALTTSAIPVEDYEELGIIAKNITKAQEVTERLHHDLGLVDAGLTAIDPADEEPLLKCIIVGQLDQLWILESQGSAVHIATKKQRELSSGTVVRQASIVVGTPFDLEVVTPAGLEVLELVNNLTAVEPSWLTQLAPGQFKIRAGKTYFDSYFGTLAAAWEITYRGKTISTAGSPILERTDANQQQFRTLFSRWVYQQLELERQTLHGRPSQQIRSIPIRQIEDQVRHLAPGVISLAELPKKDKIELLKLAKLERWVGRELVASLTPKPNQAGTPNKRRKHGWKPKTKLKDRWRNRDNR